MREPKRVPPKATRRKVEAGVDGTLRRYAEQLKPVDPASIKTMAKPKDLAPQGYTATVAGTCNVPLGPFIPVSATKPAETVTRQTIAHSYTFGPPSYAGRVAMAVAFGAGIGWQLAMLLGWLAMRIEGLAQ